MDAVPLDILSEPARSTFIADRDEFVELLIHWVTTRTADDLLRKHANLVNKDVPAHAVLTAEWSYDSKGDVRFKAVFNSKLVNLLSPEFCTKLAKKRWQEAQALMPEVVYGAKFRAFVKKHQDSIDTRALPNGDFAALMRKRRER